MVATQFITGLLLVSAALASPASRSRNTKRYGHQSHFLGNTTVIDNTSYNGNWAGAVISDAANTFTNVVGTFTVPGSSGADGASTAWVGIDGASCQTALIQTGVTFTISGGDVSYNAWLEYIPAAEVSYDGSIDFAEGDSVTVSIAVTSSTSGTASIVNNSNGQRVSQDISSSTPLCQQDAEWIVEDFSENGGEVPFGDFGQVIFTGGSATKTDGSTVDPSTAGIFDIQQNGVDMTSSSLSPGGVTVNWLSAA
ncbi:concanavalin A-like lectin/glucanase [Athelia psychrophila]|uniref:Concanavalin A-like lectin/glucanase n=1 Tax=Athelia psychrophila TaxID=1759441 RepID=A0A166BAT7_9AGAM|nr:concanavalin A-like lectin/glucanase [Fibularhizoctonia sp. CBS 109695]